MRNDLNELLKWRSGEYGLLNPLMKNVLYHYDNGELTVQEAVERLVALKRVSRD